MPTRIREDPANLPPATGGLIGREWELNRVGALLLGPARLVTLIGSGGIGKTRLAEEGARRLQRARRTPVFNVRLARLPAGSDAASVREAITTSVLVDGFVGGSAWDGAVQRLSPLDATGRVVDTVLVLDNCEHLRASVGTVITDLLAAASGLTILATSREPVGWVDEQLVTVPPLSAKQSLELFRQRAELAGYPIAEPGQMVSAERICRHMHGNPLCIRLAAARMFYEPLSMILQQLSGESDDMRMQWRHGPRVGSERRHRTISDVIAWSYELCGDKLRLLFDRLSVFAPGHDVNPDEADTGVADLGAELEAIEAICADDVPIPGCKDAPRSAGADKSCAAAVGLARTEIRELLEQLVERSLVSVHITDDAVRYFLLESLRLFASERLAERSTVDIDEPNRLAGRHCYYYCDKVLHAQAELFGPAEQQLLSWASGAWSNIRRAIDASMTAGVPIVGLQISVGLMLLRALFLIGSLAEIRHRVEQTLAATKASWPQVPDLEVAAMALSAWLALLEGRPQETEELLERCVAACDSTAAYDGYWRDRPETDIGLPAVVEFAMGVELMFAYRDRRAITVLARARDKFGRRLHQSGESMSAMFEAIAASFFGSPEQAMTICQRHLERTRATGAGLARSWAELALAIALTKHGDVHEALRLGRAAMLYQVTIGDQWGSQFALHVRMWSLARLITDQRAAGRTSRRSLVELGTEIAYLAGAVKTQRARMGVVIETMGPVGEETSTAETLAREVLGHKTYAGIEHRGSGLSPARFEPQRLALGMLTLDAPPVEDPAATATSSTWQILSEAEREVAILAAAGWPNSAIGMHRGTSTRTIDAQLSSIFHKLDINSREDIAQLVPQDQRSRVASEQARIPRLS